jgi:Ca2+-binding EF-hand superfamily protein
MSMDIPTQGARSRPPQHTIADMTNRAFQQSSDGMIDIAGTTQRGPTQLFAAADAAGNSDGQLSKDEFTALLARGDSNADGTLSREERKGLASSLGISMPEHARGDRPGGGRGAGRHGARGPVVITEFAQQMANRMSQASPRGADAAHDARRSAMLARVDADGDGTATAAEIAADLTRRDIDGDGQLSTSEFRALRQAQAGATATTDTMSEQLSTVDGGGTADAASAASLVAATPASIDFSALKTQIESLLASLRAAIGGGATAVQQE